MPNIAGIREIKVADAVSSPGRVIHPIVYFLKSFERISKRKTYEGVSGARQPEFGEVAL